VHFKVRDARIPTANDYLVQEASCEYIFFILLSSLIKKIPQWDLKNGLMSDFRLMARVADTGFCLMDRSRSSE
jgi:hypothetical protein